MNKYYCSVCRNEFDANNINIKESNLQYGPRYCSERCKKELERRYDLWADPIGIYRNKDFDLD